MSGGVGFDIFARDKTAQAFASVNNRVAGLNKKFSNLKNAVGGFGKLLGAGLALNFFKQVGENASKLNDLSDALGIGTEQLSRYQYMADLQGVSLETMSKGMIKLGSSAVIASQGTNAQSAALQKLGIDSTTFKNLGMDQQFALLAEKIQGVENPSERVKIAMDLMGKSGVEMLKVAQGGSSAFLEMANNADSLGVTLKKTQAEAIDKMMDSFTNVGYAVKGVAQDLLAFLAPAITKIVNAVAWAISQFQVFDGAMTKIGWGLVSLGNKVGVVSDETYKLATIEAYERIHGGALKTNKVLEDQEELLEKINGSMSRAPVEHKKMSDKVKQGNKEIEDSTKGLGDTWSESIKNVSLDFDDLRGSALRAIQDIGQAMLQQVLNQQFGSTGSTGSSFNFLDAAGQLGDLFGGFFAEGGSFSSGKPIVVGEQGPEIIMPRRGGTVIPNDQIGGGRSTVVNVHISTPDAQSFRRSQSQITAQIAQAVAQGNRNL